MTGFRPDFVLLDLGVSSRQLDEDGTRIYLPTRRAARHADGRAGATRRPTLLNGWTRTTLERIFADYGDERRARRLAREVVRRRERGAVRDQRRPGQRHPAVAGAAAGPSEFARLFQAVRIAVNEELAGLAARCRRFATRWRRAARCA